MVEAISTVKARNQFSTLINRIAFGKERIVLTRRDRKLVAIVSMHDLERLLDLDPPSGGRKRDPRLELVQKLRAAGVNV